MKKKLFFVGILKTTEENNRSQVRAPLLWILTATLCYNYSPVAEAETQEYCCTPRKKIPVFCWHLETTKEKSRIRVRVPL
jgi:hypothetical protein